MKHAIKYLCIDDQDPSIIDLLLKKIASDHLSFERETPIDLAEQIAHIAGFIENAGTPAVGILLDLRLDMDADADGHKVVYRGPSLAQELRTRMTERALQFVPLVLWSVNTKFTQSFNTDESSHDLFDAVYGKDDVVETCPHLVANELQALAAGYATLRDDLSFQGILSVIGLSKDRTPVVYERFAAELQHISAGGNIHDIARFLLDYLIRPSGLLVSEEILAARLGVDIAQSGECWIALKSQIGSLIYQGPFYSAWQRWWWFDVEDWWSSLSSGKADLRRLTAEERVERLNAAFALELVPAAPVLQGYSTRYFTRCIATDLPLDPSDGLRVLSLKSKSWLDTRYVSIHAALERIRKTAWEIDPLDRDRLNEIKALKTDGQTQNQS